MTEGTWTAPGRHSDASPHTARGAFPGYGEDAPLDLSGLSNGAMADVAKRIGDRTFDAFAETAAAVHNCARPVRLVGRSKTHTDLSPLRVALFNRYGREEIALPEHSSSFSSEEAPLGVLYRACGNRRAEVCPACSRTYARDTFAMIDAGLSGGKTIPAEVAENPLLFVTFTAPSFGLVHSAHKDGSRCRPRARDTGKRCEHGRPVSCMKVHAEDDPITGAAFCPDCYDWAGAVIWQWWTPTLWRYTTQALRRALAKKLEVTEQRTKPTKKHPTPRPCLADVASLQFVKVAEYQARGLVHFHALLRLDGPDGPGSPAPLGGKDLAELLREVAAEVHFDAPPVDGDGEVWRLAWGKQLDIRVVREANRTDDPTGDLKPEQVAGYLAKYATKDANTVRVDAPRPHLARLTSTVYDLASSAAKVYGFEKRHNPYALLEHWAHMLGFRGHFSTKSRHYSVTLGRLRRARARFRALVAEAKDDEEACRVLKDSRELEARLLADEEETTLVVGEWTYQGSGWTSAGDEALALAAAARAREYDQWKAQQQTTSTRSGIKGGIKG